MRKFLIWFKANWLLILVVVIGGILRFYRLRDLTTFGGDQGIDYQNVAKMLIDGKPSLLGPITHVGIFLGPLYYYLLIPFFWVFNFDPIAAPVMFALFGTATVGLVYILAKKLFFIIHHLSSIIHHHHVFAFMTALLYAVSPVILESSRAPSQPHLIPFFATLLLISIIRIIEAKDNKWDWVVIGVSLAATIQFHFLAFPLWIFVAVILIFGKGLALPGKARPYKIFWLSAPVVVLLFPWFLFELRHNFFITNQIFAYLKTGEVSFFPAGYLERALDLIWFSFDRLVGQGSQFVTAAAIVLAVSGLVGAFFKETPRVAFGGVGCLLIMFAFYFLINVFGISFYYSPLSNHYISALYPVIILFFSSGLFQVFFNFPAFTLRSRALLCRVVFIMFIIFIFSRNDLSRNHGYTMPEGLTTPVIQRGSLLVAQNVTTKKFQIASILDGDTRAGPYRYILEFVYRKVPMKVEEYPDAEGLFVVARRNPLNVLNNTVWEISSFQPEKIANSWDIGDNIVLYQLEKEKQ